MQIVLRIFLSKLLFDDTINDTTNDTIKNRQYEIIGLIKSPFNNKKRGSTDIKHFRTNGCKRLKTVTTNWHH